MTLIQLKKQFKLLLSKVVVEAISTSTELQRLRGIAFFDTQKDSFITSLPQFCIAETGVRELEQVRKQYGAEESHRIVLQFVYQYFKRTNEILIDDSLLDSLWSDFVAELNTPVWITRAVTNLRNFHCEDHYIDLGDGVAIYGRSQEVLTDLGFKKDIIDRLFADWGGFGSSSFVLVTEVRVLKQPDNFLMLDGGVLLLRRVRAIGAMRLIAAGDVGISATYIQRIARFNVGMGGVTSTGATIDTIGVPYIWSSAQLQLYKSTYAALDRLEKNGYSKSPGNLDLALRAFMSTYDRFPTAMDTKLVDSITALEAVLGSESESTFKLSFRVASLFASTDEERVATLKLIKSFYDARSRIVHGGRLTDKHRKPLTTLDDLRVIVRTLLRSFVELAADAARPADKRFYKEEIDNALINAKIREELRALLGLV